MWSALGPLGRHTSIGLGCFQPTVTLPKRESSLEQFRNFSAGKLREAAVLDSEFRADSESGLRSAQSPEGKDEKFSQSPAAEMRCVLAGWLLAGRRLAAACC
jgi:hypothetical protein